MGFLWKLLTTPLCEGINEWWLCVVVERGLVQGAFSLWPLTMN